MFNLVDACRGGPVTLLVDYDGTLVPIAPTPQLAVPDTALIALLSGLTRRPQLALHIVSGRSRESIDAWFADLRATLWAEHGFWCRPEPGTGWEAAAPMPTEHLRRMYPILEEATAKTPGSFVEEKSASLAWHYRQADAEQADRAVRQLRERLEAAPGGTRFEMLNGKKVIEVRLRGMNKALVARRVLAEHAFAGPVLAIGDDETDEELFCALPDSAITIAVGPRASSAKFQVADHNAARNLLRALLI